MSTDYKNILFTCLGIRKAIAVITLNRPTRANAMNPTMAAELESAVHRAANDPGIRAIVFTGAGKHFCPGMDGKDAKELAERISRGEHPAEPFNGNLRILHRATLAIFDASKPTIAAINGSAAAGGLDLALACDYRISVGTAKFGVSYVKLNLPPLNGGAWLLRRVVRNSLAFRMLLTGEAIDASAALEMGLVDEISPIEEVLDRAVALAERASIGSLPLMAFIKSELRSEGSLRDALARAYVSGVGFIQSDEHRQAVEGIPGSSVAVTPPK
jgi:enoyl-CoA hydratase/carnithine racemase